MNEQFKNNVSPGSRQNEPDLVALIKKLQEHLVILERKIDSLINKPQEDRRSFQEKRFSKPFRSFKDSHYGKGEYNKHSREKKFSPKPNFKRDHAEDNKGFGEKKKPFFFKKKYQKQSMLSLTSNFHAKGVYRYDNQEHDNTRRSSDSTIYC